MISVPLPEGSLVFYRKYSISRGKSQEESHAVPSFRARMPAYFLLHLRTLRSRKRGAHPPPARIFACHALATPAAPTARPTASAHFLLHLRTLRSRKRGAHPPSARTFACHALVSPRCTHSPPSGAHALPLVPSRAALPRASMTSSPPRPRICLRTSARHALAGVTRAPHPCLPSPAPSLSHIAYHASANLVSALQFRLPRPQISVLRKDRRSFAKSL